MIALLKWVGRACGRSVSPNYDLVYALKRQIRYLEHDEYGDVGDLPYECTINCTPLAVSQEMCLLARKVLAFLEQIPFKVSVKQ